MKTNYAHYLLISSITLSLGLGTLGAQSDEVNVSESEKELEALFVLPVEGEADEVAEDNAPDSVVNEDEDLFTVLPEFVVSAEKDEGYYSAHSLGGTRTSALIKNTPMTIGVINTDLMNDLGLSEIDDLVEVLSGVDSEADTGFNNRAIRFRGLKTNSQLFEFMPRQIDQNSYNIERAEIIRGANSLIYGQADPGGKINFLAKRADFAKNKTSLKAEGGSNDSYSGQFDTNYVVNDKLAVRFLGIHSNQGSDFDRAEKIFEGMTFTTSYRPTDKTQVRLHLEQVRGRRQGGSSVIEGDETSQYGSTGAFEDLPVSADIVDYLPSDMIEQMINFNDGTLQDKDSNDIPDFFTSKEDIKDFYKTLALDPEDVGFYNGDDWYREITGHYILGEVIHSFTDDLSLKLGYGQEESNTIARTSATSGIRLTDVASYIAASGKLNEAIYNNGTTDVSEILEGASVNRTWKGQDVGGTFDNSYSFRSTLSWHTELFGTDQQFLISYDYDLRKTGKESLDLYELGATVGADGVVTGDAIASDIFNVVDQTGNPNTDYLHNAGKFEVKSTANSEITTNAVWFANQGKYWNGRIHTLVGARYDEIETESLSTAVAKDGYGSGSVVNAKFTELSPTIGALIWLNDNIAIFGNYSKSIQSPTGFDRDPAGNVVDPEIGTGLEGGIKFEALDGKLNGQVVVYEIEKVNEVTPMDKTDLQLLFPEATYPDFYNAKGKWAPPGGNRLAGTVVEVRGLEASLNYNPTRALSLVLSYAYNESEITESPLGDNVGETLGGTAPHSATFTARYNFKEGPLDGTYVGTSLKYQSGGLFKTYNLDDGSKSELWLSDTLQTNVFVGWKGKLTLSDDKKLRKNAPNLSVQFSVKNLFNQEDLVAKGEGRAAYTAPRTFTLSSTITF